MAGSKQVDKETRKQGAEVTVTQRLVRESEARKAQAKPQVGRPGVMVRCLVEGTYARPDFKSAGQKQPGAVFEAAGGWYAESLVRDGFVELVDR